MQTVMVAGAQADQVGQGGGSAVVIGVLAVVVRGGFTPGGQSRALSDDVDQIGGVTPIDAIFPQ